MVTQNSQSPDILQGKRVLICEDEAVTSLQLRRAVTRAGIDVLGEAPDGLESVRMAMEMKPDLILMDINMPAVDGITAAKTILKEVDTCIVFITSYSDRKYREEVEALGAGYFRKPMWSSELVSALCDQYQQWRERA